MIVLTRVYPQLIDPSPSNMGEGSIPLMVTVAASAMIDEASPEALSFIKQNWGVDDGRARSAVASLNGVFVARRDVADFGPVIASSAEALGMPPIDVADLVTFA